MSDAVPSERPRVSRWLFVWLYFPTLAVVMSARQSVAMPVMGIAGPVTGNLAGRYGARALMVGRLVVVALGVAIAGTSAGQFV